MKLIWKYDKDNMCWELNGKKYNYVIWYLDENKFFIDIFDKKFDRLVFDFIECKKLSSCKKIVELIENG